MWIQVRAVKENYNLKYRVLNEKTGIVADLPTYTALENGVFNVKDMKSIHENYNLENNCNFRWAISYNDETGVLRLTDINGNMSEYTDLEYVEENFGLIPVNWHTMADKVELQRREQEIRETASDVLIGSYLAMDTIEQPIKIVDICNQTILVRKPLPQQHVTALLDMIDKYFSRATVLGTDILTNFDVLNNSIQEYCESNNIWNSLNWDYDAVYEEIYKRLLETPMLYWVIAPLKFVRADRPMFDFYKTLNYPPKVVVTSYCTHDMSIAHRNVALVPNMSPAAYSRISTDYCVSIYELTTKPHIHHHKNSASVVFADKLCCFFLTEDDHIADWVKLRSYAEEVQFKGSNEEIWAAAVIFEEMRCKTLDLSKFRSISKPSSITIKKEVHIETLILPEQDYFLADTSNLENICSIVNYPKSLMWFAKEGVGDTSYQCMRYLITCKHLDFVDLTAVTDISLVLIHLSLCPASRFLIDNYMLEEKLKSTDFLFWAYGDEAVLPSFQQSLRKNIDKWKWQQVISLENICDAFNIIIMPVDTEHSILLREVVN